jgi:hypothetical protein
MSVPMMDVRIMWMAVRQPPVFVEMRVWLDTAPREIVLVLMVFVVRMPVRVHERLVLVPMRVALREVQPHAGRHQSGRCPE